MNIAVICTLLGLIAVITGHIVVIARWSGRIDGFMQATEQRITKAEYEITRLRDARHKSDGEIQRHTGEIRDLQRTAFNRRVADEREDEH